MKRTTNNQPLKTVMFLSCLLFVVSCGLSVVHAATFTRDLSLGAVGDDVQALQIILNSRTETQIAAYGVGSPGAETTFFGEKTKAAVIRYQNLHRSTVLSPIGLSAGTGYVGTLTRNALNQAISPLSTGSTPPYGSVSPRVTSISPQRGGVGTKVTIYGEGFLPTGNNVASAFEEFNNIESSDGKTLEIEIKGPFPEDFLKKHEDFYEKYPLTMDYQLIVSNKNGRSGFSPFEFVF